MDVVYLFDVSGHAQCVAEPIELQHTEEAYSLYAQLPGDVTVGDGWAIGFRCCDGYYRIFDILTHTMCEPDGCIEINAVDKAVRELMDEPITDLRPQNVTAAVAVGRLISGTRYVLGSVTCTNTGGMTAYYQSVWEALEVAREAYDCEIVPYFVITGGVITARKIDVLARLGDYRGRIFELGDDLAGIRVQYDESNVKTALYGRGRGVELDNGGDADPSFGRRLTFADVVWSVASGDQADKPAGQEWIGDPDALAAYGRDGRHRYGFAIFEDCEDADELLQMTWDQLQQQKEPLITIEATVLDTERAMGRSHEAVRLGDDVLIRLSKKGIDISARVIGIVRDYIRPEQTKLTIGNAVMTAGGIIKQLQQRMANFASKSSIWDRASAFDLDGVMDVMNNQIMSTTGHWYTDPSTGALMFVSSDGTKAMQLTGAGWQISSGQVGGAWVWRTAATGTGIVADEITAGILRASMVKILGTEKFYWDANNICIINPSNSSQQIRIGQYDGVNYGIAFTTDGGRTWSQSMDFNGVIATSIGALEISADKITSGTLSTDRLAANSIAVSKLTGSISAADVSGQTAWSIDLTNGTMTVGDINANHIKAGTISADRIAAASLSLTKLSASSSFDGITKISNAGIEINATSVGASAKTTIKADGLKIFNAAGTLIGGMASLPDGTVASAMQSLYNPAVSTLNVQVGSGLYGSEDGLAFKLGSSDCFSLTGADDTYRLITHGGGAQIYGSGRSLHLTGAGYAEITGPNNAKIAITSTGDIQVSWMHNGSIVTYDMWSILNGNVD